jgi:hypothetical protein
MAYLFEEGKSPNTISTYLEALSYYLKFKSKPDITNNFIIKKLVNGDKRLAAGPDISRPITVTVLGHLLQASAHVTKAYYQIIMFEAMFLLACFAFLRNINYSVLDCILKSLCWIHHVDVSTQRVRI